MTDNSNKYPLAKDKLDRIDALEKEVAELRRRLQELDRPIKMTLTGRPVEYEGEI